MTSTRSLGRDVVQAGLPVRYPRRAPKTNSEAAKLPRMWGYSLVSKSMMRLFMMSAIQEGQGGQPGLQPYVLYGGMVNGWAAAMTSLRCQGPHLSTSLTRIK